MTIKRIIIALYIIMLVLCGMFVHKYGLGSQDYKPMIVTSNSMEPTIMTGAIILVERCDYEDIEVMDIITFWSPDLGSFNTHRVVIVGEDYLVTEGDNALGYDYLPVISSNFYGRVSRIWNGASSFTSMVLNMDGTYNRLAAYVLVLMLGAVALLVCTLFAWFLVYLSAIVICLLGIVDKLHIPDIPGDYDVSALKGARHLFKKASVLLAISSISKDLSKLDKDYAKIKEG